MSSAMSLESQNRQSPEEQTAPGTAPISFKRPLVALDASDHANRALAESVRLAASDDGTVTGIHAYAARLHDRRFKQMEGGLPERYRKEEELEHQREVHDSLITRGLGVISDSYHDAALDVCDQAQVAYRRLSPEGKNYRRLVEAAETGEHDFLALGAVGLGVIPGSVIGTVCERVVRRSAIDTLVIRDPERAIGDGPLVVALDGSQRAFGALMTAFKLSRHLGAPVHAVAAYDPYFHYIAFDKISAGLSEEAGQEFRFKDQEQLHEEIIDAGIAKIYQSHLDVAQTIAKEAGVALTCELLEGKPYHVISQYLERAGASLLLLGKTGIHADPSLDIGGNAENLLRMAPCHLWFSQLTYAPPLEAVAEETISWSEEAEESLQRVPETARKMVRIAVLRYAQESGHTVITSQVMAEVTERFCP
ncbi:MAG: universal stress protein, partial [Rhodospirillaceae bacterium]|nr:universal stress protein [Rhodospirillaceae bacterium]